MRKTGTLVSVSAVLGHGLDVRLMFLVILDDPEIYDGAPVGVQIVARKFEEEKVLAIAKVVYSALNA